MNGCQCDCEVDILHNFHYSSAICMAQSQNLRTRDVAIGWVHRSWLNIYASIYMYVGTPASLLYSRLYHLHSCDHRCNAPLRALSLLTDVHGFLVLPHIIGAQDNSNALFANASTVYTVLIILQCCTLLRAAKTQPNATQCRL